MVKPASEEVQASLTITTQPDSEIFINGDRRGVTNDTGILIASVKPSQQLVVVATKLGYEPGKRSTSLEPGESISITIELTANPGKLSVIPSVAGSDIFVSGLGAYKDKVTDLKVAPGSYSISVSKACYQKRVSEVVVKPDETSNVEIPLSLQPLDDLLGVAEANWQIRNYDNAMTAVKCILNAMPTHPRANFMMGWSLYWVENYSASSSHLVMAINGGEQISLPIAYYYAKSYHQGYLILSKQTLEFHSSIQGEVDFSIPAKKIYALTVMPDRGYRLRVTVGMPNGQKEVRRDLDFHPPRGTAKNSNCPTCKGELEVLYSLLLQLRN